MPNKTLRVAIKNVRRLQEEFDNTKKPDFRLRQDLADARTYLGAVKAKERAKQKTNTVERLIQAEKEAARKAKKTARASRQGSTFRRHYLFFALNIGTVLLCSKDLSSYSGYNVGSKKPVFTIQTCPIVRVVNQVSEAKKSVHPMILTCYSCSCH